jgi:hypothetical protein
MWMRGPSWLNNSDSWLEQIVAKPSDVSESESRTIKTVMKAAVQRKSDVFDDLLAKTTLWETVRILAWIKRFAINCRRSKRISGPLTTEETEEQLKFLIKRAHGDGENSVQFKEHSQRLNLQKNEESIYACKGRIQVFYPIYLPSSHLLFLKIVERAHLYTLHGRFGLTMSKVRDDYWIPTLRSLVKKVIGNAIGVNDFTQRQCPLHLTGIFQKNEIPFEVTGVDYAGSIYYKGNGGAVRKSHIVI